MTEFQINCVRKDDRGVIWEVGINGKIFTVKSIVDYIHQNRNDRFYTMKYGQSVWVYPKQHPTSFRWFLTTQPDSIYENNLDFLPTCI